MTYSILMPDSACGETCIIPVCGCIDAMHGRKFKNLIGEVAKHFSAVRLILCDSLDAYNMADPDGPLWCEAEQVSRNAGDVVIEQRRDIDDFRHFLADKL